jgi:hypothetical protein
VLKTRVVFRNGAATPLGPAVSFGGARRCGGGDCALARSVCSRSAGVESPQGLGTRGGRSDGAERLRRSMRCVWPRALRGRRGRRAILRRRD